MTLIVISCGEMSGEICCLRIAKPYLTQSQDCERMYNPRLSKELLLVEEHNHPNIISP